MQFRDAAPVGSSSSTDWGMQSPLMSPLVLCPFCHIQLVRIRSKQPETFGQIFVKCPNSIKGDPSSCRFIKSEAQYAGYLRKEEEKKMIPFGPVDGSVQHNVAQKQVDELKERLDSVVTDLSDLRVQVQKLKMDYFVIAAVCVGVGIGCLISKIW